MDNLPDAPRARTGLFGQIAWSAFLALLPGFFLGALLLMKFGEDAGFRVLLEVMAASLVFCTIVIFYIRKAVNRHLRPAADKLVAQLPPQEHQIIFLPLKDGRTWADNVRTIWWAIGVNVSAAVIMWLIVYSNTFTADTKQILVLIAAAYAFVFNMSFCIPRTLVLDFARENFILKYDNTYQKTNTYHSLRTAPYAPNMLIAVSVVATVYAAFAAQEIFAILLIGDAILYVCMILLYKCLVPRARLSSVENWIVSVPLMFFKHNIYYTRGYVLSFFDVTFCSIILGFWAVIIHRLFLS